MAVKLRTNDEQTTNNLRTNDQLEAPLGYAWGVVGHLMGVDNSDELRAVHTAMQPAVIAARYMYFR